MKRVYSVSTRIDMTDETIKEYLNDYITFYNSIQRRMFHDICHNIPKEMGMSRYITHICNAYNILKRTANSIRHEMQGRINSYMELKKVELKQLDIKIHTVRKKTDELEEKILKMKTPARDNKLDECELNRYRNAKTSLYHKKNRLNKLCQRKLVLEQNIKDKKVSLCFGSKKLFDKQNRLTENEFKSHEKWLNAFKNNRDSNIFFLGSGDETCGNQILQLKRHNDSGGFLLKLRKDKPYESDGGKYLFTNVKFKYLEKEIFIFIVIFL